MFEQRPELVAVCPVQTINEVVRDTLTAVSPKIAAPNGFFSPSAESVTNLKIAQFQTSQLAGLSSLCAVRSAPTDFDYFRLKNEASGAGLLEWVAIGAFVTNLFVSGYLFWGRKRKTAKK